MKWLGKWNGIVVLLYGIPHNNRRLFINEYLVRLIRAVVRQDPGLLRSSTKLDGYRLTSGQMTKWFLVLWVGVHALSQIVASSFVTHPVFEDTWV